MNTNDFPTADASATLHRIAAAKMEPSADLWPRIEAAHALRVRRRQRFAASGIFGAALLAAIVAGGLHPRLNISNPATDIDWQARAQALELQLHALERGGAAAIVARDADPAAAELADIDHRLQAAYERKMYPDELASLWKRRSELLDTMITARRQGLSVTRI